MLASADALSGLPSCLEASEAVSSWRLSWGPWSRQSTMAFRSISSFHSCSLRCSHLEIWCSYFLMALYHGSPVSSVWVLLMECRELDSSGDDVMLWGRNAWLDFGHMFLSECCLKNTVLDLSETLWLLPQCLARQWVHIPASVLGFLSEIRTLFYVSVD